MKGSFALFLTVILILTLFSACTPRVHPGVDSSGLEPFVIGGIGPLTEDSSERGLSVKNGAQMAIDEINATGGVNGFRLVLNFQDSKATPQTAITVYEKLKANDMNVLLGGVLSEETAALSRVSAVDGFLTITPTAGAKEALGSDGNAFRVCSDNTRSGIAAANFLADKKLATDAAVVYSENFFDGEEIYRAFFTTCTSRGIRTTPKLFPIQGKASDPNNLKLFLKEIKERSFDAIYLVLSPEDTELFLKNYTRGEELIFFSTPPKDNPLYEGLLQVTAFCSEEENILAKNFIETYEQTFQTKPDSYAADAYDAVYAIAEAIKRAGITPSNVEESDTNQKLIEAMKKIEVHGVTGTMSWTTDGETTRPATIRIFQKGTFVPFIPDETGENP